MSLRIEIDAPEADSVLVADCLEREPQAWLQLLSRYKRLIYSVTVRFGFSVDDRHDIFQSVCLEILKNLSSLRCASSLRYWILTITIRQCSVLRKRRNQDLPAAGQELWSLVSDPGPGTLEVYLEARRNEILREAITELPPRCRIVLDQLFLRDSAMSYEELGREIGCSKESIGSTRLRCLDKLRRILLDKGF